MAICRPLDKSVSTTIKKRSFLQAQFHKADKPINEVKDHIITDISLQQFYVSEITGEISDNKILPRNEHPYDHYAIAAFLDYPTDLD